ncbi:MAG: DUF459 domain-containing protein [Pseudomonadota bacterium]
MHPSLRRAAPRMARDRAAPEAIVRSDDPTDRARLLPGLALAAVAFFMALAVTTARADDTRIATVASYETTASRERIVVIGDSVGANLADGLKWAFRKDRSVRVIKRTKAGTGLARRDVYDWPRALRRIIRRDRPDRIVILIGGNDRQDMRVRGRRYHRFTKPWGREYVRRLERFTNQLDASGAQVTWIGLPNVRSRRMTRDYRQFNSWVRRAAKRRGMDYIPIKPLFVARNGGYDAYGRGVNGRRVRLRDRDGIHMSRHGSRLMGRFVAERLKRQQRTRSPAADAPRKKRRNQSAAATH